MSWRAADARRVGLVACVAVTAGCLTSPRITEGGFSYFGLLSAAGGSGAGRSIAGGPGATTEPGAAYTLAPVPGLASVGGLPGAPTPTPTPAPTSPPMPFVTIQPGTFTMGSPAGELGRQSDETQHQVTLTRRFDLQTTEVTQGQWQELMGNNPSDFKGDALPVESVNWWEALAYANALSAKEGLVACYSLEGCSGTAGAGMACSGVTVTAVGGDPYLCTGYRLPTEAEWEYAYRAGTTTAFYSGTIKETGCYLDANLDAIGWYCDNAGGTTHPVAQKQANAWGVYDMAGNVWEWTWDWYGTYPGTTTDPLGSASGSYRVRRGGSWYYSALSARAASRLILDDPDYRFNGHLGFRLARSRP